MCVAFDFETKCHWNLRQKGFGNETPCNYGHREAAEVGSCLIIDENRTGRVVFQAAPSGMEGLI